MILDCTFRDGGYYNNWHFDRDLARKYLSVMEKSGVDAIEIGFRSPRGNRLGDFANVTDEFIDKYLFRPKVKYFGVMINNTERLIYFPKQEDSLFNLVRVATHFKDIDIAEIVCKSLKYLGYTVTCNLMQASIRTKEEIKEAVKKINTWGIDILYFADSFGGMAVTDVDNLYKAARGWGGEFGFHGHNNRERAVENSMMAYYGCQAHWIDGTILGMGRGAGNAQTEILLTEFNYKPDEVYELAMKFMELKERYKWGPSLPYYLSAKYNIHPTYIQEILANGKDVLESIKCLKLRKDANTFNKKVFEEL